MKMHLTVILPSISFTFTCHVLESQYCPTKNPATAGHMEAHTFSNMRSVTVEQKVKLRS